MDHYCDTWISKATGEINGTCMKTNPYKHEAYKDLLLYAAFDATSIVYTVVDNEIYVST